MADKDTKPTKESGKDEGDNSAVPGRPGPSVQDVDVPVNSREDTEEAAEAAIKENKKRDFTPSVEKGADKAFNTWLRKAHENGNPEQLTPMQAEQNIRDMARPEESTIGKQHDMDHEDTRWVVEHGLAS